MSRYPLEGYRETCDTASRSAPLCEEPDRAGYPDHHCGDELSAPCPARRKKRWARRDRCRHLDHDRRWRHDARKSAAIPKAGLSISASRYGMNPDDLRRADAIEIVVGQGAKARRRRHAAGPENLDRVAEMRNLPEGIDQRSACRHPDWTGPDDLEIKILELREITNWEKPIYIKVGGARPYFDTTLAVKAGRRCRRAGRHAGRHGGDAGRLHRTRRPANARLHPPCGAGAAGSGHAPSRCSLSCRAVFAMGPTSPRRWHWARMQCPSDAALIALGDNDPAGRQNIKALGHNRGL